MLTAQELRNLNLIEALGDELRELGLEFEEPPEDAYAEWTEERIRAHFARQCGNNPAAVVASYPPACEEQLRAWFPALQASRASLPAPGSPRLRLLAFPSAGNAEDMYTSEGTGARRVPNALKSWCRQQGVEVWAVQPPGRGARIREAPCSSAQDMAARVFALLAPALAAQSHVPLVVVSHSMGCWVAFELVLLLRAAGLPLPACWVLSCMPAPNIPQDYRPWRVAATLSEAEFKVECRGWDINETVFSSGMWELYQPLLRADFAVFDQYAYTHGSRGGPSCSAVAADEAARAEAAPAVPLGVPIVAFWAAQDRRVTKQMVAAWEAFAAPAAFELHCIDGNHLFPLLHAAPRSAWFTHIIAQLDKVMTSKGSN